MAYKFKSDIFEIDGITHKQIKPRPLPSSPTNGTFWLDSSDMKFKVWLSNEGRWIILGDAEDIKFDNSSNGFSSDNVQDAIEEVRNNPSKVQDLQFQFIGQMNYTQYLRAPTDHGSKRSGDISNGYRYSNSAPLVSSISGRVIKASANITGIAQSTGSPASSLELKFELWKVGFSGEGTKLGDIIFTINTSNYTIGNWWDSSILTAFSEVQTQDVQVSEGDLLGLKFIRQTGNNKVVAITNTTINLSILGS